MVPQQHHAEFRRCLLELDVETARQLWAALFPAMEQPKDDAEMLHTLHYARTVSNSVPKRMKEYSQRWLKEREVGKTALGVGVAVIAPLRRARQALNVREAMEYSVMDSYKRGIHLDAEAGEVKRRLLLARDKELGIVARKRAG